MKKIILLFYLLIFLVSNCSIQMKQPPVYQEKEEKVKIDGGEEYKEKANQATENFHKLFNEGKYQELFDLIDDKSQLKSDRVYWDRRLNDIKTDLRRFENSKFTRDNTFKKSKTVEVRTEYISKYEKDNSDKPRYELFYWEIYENGDVKLLEYKNGIDYEKGY